MLSDCVTEVGIVSLAAFLTSRLQMGSREKVTVITAFAWRLVCVMSELQTQKRDHVDADNEIVSSSSQCCTTVPRRTL